MFQGFQNFLGYGTVGTATTTYSRAGGYGSLEKSLFHSTTERMRYHIHQELGRGKFACVYLAYDHRSMRDVAIKKNSADVLEKGLKNAVPSVYSDKDKFIIMDKHPNIVQYLDSYRDDEGKLCLVTEFCPGGNLQQFVDIGRLPEQVASNFLLQISHGLNHLHKHRFIHRDMKPENVLLTSQSFQARIKIADFDFCRRLSGEEMDMTVCGSPQYMAPEVFQSVGFHVYGIPADVWSLGALFYFMLTGKVPFTGNNLIELYCAILNTPLPLHPPSGVSENSWNIARQLLTVDVKERMTLDKLIFALTPRSPTSSSVSSSRTSNCSDGLKESSKGNSKQGMASSLVPSSPNPLLFPNRALSSSFIAPPPSFVLTSVPSPPICSSPTNIHFAFAALLVFAKGTLEVDDLVEDQASLTAIEKAVRSSTKSKKCGLVVSFLLWLALVGKKIVQMDSVSNKKELLLELQEIIREIDRILAACQPPFVLACPLDLIPHVYEKCMGDGQQYELSVLLAAFGIFNDVAKAIGYINDALTEKERLSLDSCMWIFDRCRGNYNRILVMMSSKSPNSA